MAVILSHCARLDVHQKRVMACRITPDPPGRQADGVMERKEFGTMTVDLLTLCDWLAEAGIAQLGMESTSEYGQPGLNLLAGKFAVCLVNAVHVPQVGVPAVAVMETVAECITMRFDAAHAATREVRVVR